MGAHTYILLNPERKKPNTRLEVIEYDENGNPVCYYAAYWVPWRHWKLYPAYNPNILNKNDKVKTVPETAVRVRR